MSKLYRARSLLYRRQILQENIRWKALDEIYKLYMLLHRSDVNISEKREGRKVKMSKLCPLCESKKHVNVNLVDLVKSFPTNIFLQILASIQKRTSPLKFAHLDEKSEKGSVSNLATKVLQDKHGCVLLRDLPTPLERRLRAASVCGTWPLESEAIGNAHSEIRSIRRHSCFIHLRGRRLDGSGRYESVAAEISAHQLSH